MLFHKILIIAVDFHSIVNQHSASLPIGLDCLYSAFWSPYRLLIQAYSLIVSNKPSLDTDD